MTVHERRQHFRIDDLVYFDYAIENLTADTSFHQSKQRYCDIQAYITSINDKLTPLMLLITQKEPKIADYLHIMNAKIDYLLKSLSISDNTSLKEVNISLGGMSFKTLEKINEQTRIIIMIYAKPDMIALTVNATVIYSRFIDENTYRTAIQFDELTHEQEQLLSRHIMLKQGQCRLDSDLP